MKQFIGFYRWGMYMKSHMALYTLALIFVKGVYGFFTGVTDISIFILLEMLITGLAAAILEVLCFPQDKELQTRELKLRSFFWAAGMNVIFVSAAILGGWFDRASAGMGLLLIMFLEFGLAAMWVGVHIAQKVDTRRLNKGLEHYQRKTDESGHL